MEYDRSPDYFLNETDTAIKLSKPDLQDSFYKKFDNLNYEVFKKLATDSSKSSYEKIGFPDSYRKGKERYIFKDMVRKLSNLNSSGKTILDIGPGCSDLPSIIINHCKKKSHQLTMIDSAEMLHLLPEEEFLKKIPAYYPGECLDFITEFKGKIDVLIAYSILHYVYDEGNIFKFLDLSLSLLAEGGQMLIGDIPNVSKRKRFFSSKHGISFHKKFMNTDSAPVVEYNTIENNCIDDAVVESLISRARLQGFDAYWMPQPPTLPMANRREDVLIIRP